MSASTRGVGYWYDRRKRRYLVIHDHAIDASENPQRFRMIAADVARLLGDEFSCTEAGRALLIPAVCARGFIRVRLTRRHLGWQFAGDLQSAMQALKRFATRHEIGDALEVTVTDFTAGTSIEALLGPVLARIRSPHALGGIP